MSDDKITPAEAASLKQAIRQSLDGILQKLRVKDWKAAVRLTDLSEVSFKGATTSIEELLEKADHVAAGVTDLEANVQQVLAYKLERQRADATLRLVVTATKIHDGSPDGIVVDLRLRFRLEDGTWTITEMHVDCPPEECQWNNLGHVARIKTTRRVRRK